MNCPNCPSPLIQPEGHVAYCPNCEWGTADWWLKHPPKPDQDEEEYQFGWSDPRQAWADLGEKWGQQRVTDVVEFMTQHATDYRGLLIALSPTPPEVEKVLASIYVPEHVTVAVDEFVVVRP